MVPYSCAAVGQERALLCLANNTCVTSTFTTLRDRFVKLYRTKAYRHHYLAEGMEESRFDTSLASLNNIISLYDDVHASEPVAPASRLLVY